MVLKLTYEIQAPPYIQNLQKRIKKKKKPKQKLCIYCTNGIYESLEREYCSSRAVHLEKAANVPPSSNSDFLEARWKPATSLQVQEGKPFKDPRSLPSSSLPWLKPLLVTPAQCPAQHSWAPGTRSPYGDRRGLSSNRCLCSQGPSPPKAQSMFL